MIPSNEWSVAAEQIKSGWSVVRYGQAGGESHGTVTISPALVDNSLQVSVSWDFKGNMVEEDLTEPTWRRSIRASDGAFVVGSTETLLIFESNDD